MTRKTMAVLAAVVFLLFTATSCKSPHQPDHSAVKKASQPERRIKRKRVADYSRLPVNTPAGWQTNMVGH